MRLIDADKIREAVRESRELTIDAKASVFCMLDALPTAAAGTVSPRKHTEAYDQDSEPDAWWNEHG